MARIAVIGLGLIGGSAALAFRAAGHHVIGYARRPQTRDLALRIGAVDSAPAALADAVRADVVLLAPPVLAVRQLFIDISPHLPDRAVVTDAASTKSDVERWALETLPTHVRWVGGHPMAGKETAGIEHADASLFRERPWCIVPPPHADPEAVRLVTDLAVSTGARTIELDAQAHDQAVAAVSHLPFTVAAALAATIIDSPTFDALSRVAGSGLRDMTRLASGDATMHRDIVLTNRDNLVDALERYAGSLNEVLDLLRRLPEPDAADDSPAVAELGDYFGRLKEGRDRWVGRR